jgi:glycosyltransferase involved in cell wall biosynthesis
MQNSKPEVSVIIPAYNDATYIDRLLLALSKQNYNSFEVIVSDA